MATKPNPSLTLLSLIFLTTLSHTYNLSHQQQQQSQQQDEYDTYAALDPAEQEAAYQVLSLINPNIPWRSLFPDDLCLSSPHGLLCDYFVDEDSVNGSTITAHITHLSFGFVSDYTPNPPCSPNATIDPLVFTSFKFLRKLFFYNCFTGPVPVSFPDAAGLGSGFGSSLEELVLVQNQGLVMPLSGIVGNFTNLRRLVLSGNGVFGNIPDNVGELVNVEEVTLSWNKLSGTIPLSVSKLKKLRVLDLSHNLLDGNVPDSLGCLQLLLKLDLGYNWFFGEIPESLVHLQELEFMDLSFNKFGNCGVPLFLGEMPKLKEVHLNGNLLGGTIPEIWEKLGGLSGIGFSKMGLVGKIPASMGLHLKSLCYLGLDNNRLEGQVPEEFGSLFELVKEINLENNNLSGRFPFSPHSNFTTVKMKLSGNSRLCVDQGIFGFGGKMGASLGDVKICNKHYIRDFTSLHQGSSSNASSSAKKDLCLCNVLVIAGLLILSLALMDFRRMCKLN